MFSSPFPDTFRSAAVVLCIKLRSKAILAQGLPPSYDEQKATSVSALHASHVSIQPYLKDSLKESAREDSQYCKLLYTLKQDFPFTLKQREKLMSLAVVGGYTDIVKLLSRREICVSDIHFKLAAKYGRVHTARLLMQLRWNSDLLRAEAEDYGNNAIVQLATKHELPSKSSFQDKWVRFLNSNLNMIEIIVPISQFNMFFVFGTY